MGLVFQYPEYQLFEETVYKDIAFGPRNMGLSEEEIDQRVRQSAQFVGLTEEQLEQSPFELSGGQKRRVAIAGVIAMEPEVLILDEPTAGLDPVGRDEILSNIRAYHDAKNATIILVSHSMEEVAQTVDRVVVINDGTIPLTGTPQEVFSHEKELTAMGLGIPKVTQVCERLRSMGLPIQDGIYTLEAATAEHAEAGREGGSSMLKEITLGQYFPGDTFLHRLDPRTKLMVVVLFIVALFLCQILCQLRSDGALFGLIAWRCPRSGLKALFKGMKPVIFILIFTGVLNLFYSSEAHYDLPVEVFAYHHWTAFTRPSSWCCGSCCSSRAHSC